MKARKITQTFLFLTFIIECLIFNSSCQKSNKINLNEYSVSNILIYLDPGHGGFDGGTTVNGIMEKDITLQVCEKITTYLQKTGIQVKLTRKKDQALGKNKKEDIYKRVDLINKSKPFLYLTIHVNSYPSKKVSGAQTFYDKANDCNKEIAIIMMNMLKIIDPSNQRQAKVITGKYLLEHVNIQGCLIELGFLTNDEEHNKLINNEYQEKIALMIYLGILEYIEITGVK